MAHLFDTLKLASLELPHRIAVSPMCQYSAVDGVPNEWHMVHLGSRAAGGAAMVIAEASAVTPQARISPGDTGIWNQQQVEAWARVTRFIREQGCYPGIQLAHAGRKASSSVPWLGGKPVPHSAGGWTPDAPSPLPFDQGYEIPHELTSAQIQGICRSFADAAVRALEAGFLVIELHAAHGYLLHSFLSPLSNQRTDQYGGTFDNRIRALCEVTSAVRAVWPVALPLLVRVSCTDWAEGGWSIDETVELARRLKALGVDLIDCSSGGSLPGAIPPTGPGYQTGFAERIRREAGIATGAVGMISSPVQADHIIRTGQADLVFLAREMLRDPYFPMRAARELGHKIAYPKQYLRGGPPGMPIRESLPEPKQ